jgi:gas vesicle protein
MTNGRYSGAHLLIAFLAGTAAGAAVTLLYAPRTGRDTRDRLGGWIRDAQSRATRVPHAVRVAIDRSIEAAQEAFDEAMKEETQPPQA